MLGPLTHRLISPQIQQAGLMQCGWILLDEKGKELLGRRFIMLGDMGEPDLIHRMNGFEESIEALARVLIEFD
jgi:hypothetical protein